MENKLKRQKLQAFLGELIYGELDELELYVADVDGDAIVDPIKGFRILHRVAQGAVMENGTETARFVIERMGAKPNATDNAGDSALHHAAQYSSEMGMFEYLASVCDINLKNNKGEAPIIKSVLNGNMSGVLALSNLGADLDVNDRDGNTLQHIMMSQFGKEGTSAWEAVVLARTAQSVNIEEIDGRKTADLGDGYVIDLTDIEACAKPQQASRRRL